MLWVLCFLIAMSGAELGEKERTSEDVTCGSIQKELISHISKFSLYPWKRQEDYSWLLGRKWAYSDFCFRKIS